MIYHNIIFVYIGTTFRHFTKSKGLVDDDKTREYILLALEITFAVGVSIYASHRAKQELDKILLSH